MIVAAFGTSLTARASWPGRLAIALRDRLNRPVDVVAVAKGGATTRWATAHVQHLVDLRPDLILIEFAINDAALHRCITLRRSRHAIDAILARLRALLPEAKVMMMAMNPTHGLRGLLRPRLNAYVAAHRQAALAAGAGFIDHRPVWAALSLLDRRRAIPDGVHPLDHAAATVMVDTIASHIVQTLSRQEPEAIAR